jgi:hypothetical protein
MQKALRGGDSPAILILSINIKRPVATGRRQGFPEFAGTSCAGLRWGMRMTRRNRNPPGSRLRDATRTR